MTVTSSTPFLTNLEQSQIRDLVRKTAAIEIMPRFQNLSAQDVSTKSRDDDLVTKADLASEAMITAGLQTLFPKAVVVGEEAISKHPSLRSEISDHEICFVIDPIDGTWNFANGILLFGIILAVLHYGQPIYGLLYDPVMDDFIEADLGQSSCDFSDAKDRRRSLRTAQPRAAEDLTGYIHFGLLPKEIQFTLAPHLPKFRRTSVLRCSCHEYRIMAQGNVDFCLSSILNPWDHAAGVLTTQLAGGTSKMLDDQEYNTRHMQGYLLSASSEETWNTVADILRPVLLEE
jgi:fructose-1,6-bisphosphatase/inositol monophosphatase family enzyme